MRRCHVSRLAAMAIAVLAGISVPGLGVAHGYAHHDASGLELHEHPSNAEPITESRDGLYPPTGEASDSKTHVHPQLAYALSARMYAPLFLQAGLPETTRNGVELARTASVLFATAPAPARSPPDAAPKQSRAPPAG